MRTERDRLLQAQSTLTEATVAQVKIKELEAALAAVAADLAVVKQELARSRGKAQTKSGQATLGAVSVTQHPAVQEDSRHPHRVTVQKGDSLWSLARQYGLTLEELKETNGLTSDQIMAGQQLVIPTIP